MGAGVGLVLLLLALLAWPREDGDAPPTAAGKGGAEATSVASAVTGGPSRASAAPSAAAISPAPARTRTGGAAPSASAAASTLAPPGATPGEPARASTAPIAPERPSEPDPREPQPREPAEPKEEPGTGFLGGTPRGFEAPDPSPKKLAPLDQLFEETVRLLRPKRKKLAELEEVTVERAVDGDTLWTKDKQKIRLIGINTPEKGFPVAKDATSLLAALTVGKKVRLEDDVDKRDQFKRRLAYVYVGERCVNGEMVRHGVAHYYRWEPNVAHAEEILALQKLARADGLGIWSLPKPAPLAPGERYLCGAKEHVFHHPSCPRARKTLEREGEKGMAYFDSREDAFDSGRKPDPDCDR